MTHQNHQTNGASLEDCHTNFFALTELYGIKWRKLVWGETSGGGGDGEEGAAPLTDPVISSYARCLAGDILCVWRRVPAPQQPDIYEMSAPAPPPLSLRAAKELWIFWYGEEPDLNGLVAPELIAGQGDQGSWESGLSYECRSLLFKALHNLIERCLLSRDFVRLGKWFVQPYDGDEEDVGKSPWHLSFSFAFFLHGESTVCASVDVRQHPPVRTLTAKRLARLHAQDCDADAKVILAPFGLEGTVTGREWNDSDAATSRLLDAWRQLYPLEQGCGAVEVVCGGVRMRYPLPYALVTEMEAPRAPPPDAAALAARTLHALTTDHPTMSAEIDYPEANGEKGEDFADPTRKTPCTCAKVNATGATVCSPGSCGGGSPAAAVSAPSSAGAAPPSPHHTTLPSHQSSAAVPTTLHTPAPTPDPHAPPTPAPPSAPPPKLYNQGDSPPSGATNSAPCPDALPVSLVKRPVLPRAERRVDPLEDEHSLHMLYDYTTVHAWLEHPVKRFKSEENCFREELALGAGAAGDLYAGHEHIKMAAMPNYALLGIKQEKQEPNEDVKEYKNLFTSDGLCPTLKDLDQIFDNSDDAASGDETVRLLQVQTPPDSNKSVEETRCRPCVRAEELSKMFPTPPSLEAHAQPSPGFTLPDDATPQPHPHRHNAGSPPPDPIEDWSYVFKPPTVYKYVGSSKYAPLATLPSQLLPPVTLPAGAVYRPRWQHDAKPRDADAHAHADNHRPGVKRSASPLVENRDNTRRRTEPAASGGSRAGSVAASPAPRPPAPAPAAAAAPAPAAAAAAAAAASPAAALRAAPPACPLLLNVLLADTVLNVFRDHNFDSCTLCVCNAGPKVVGNIRGADAATYLSGGMSGEESPGASPAPDDEPGRCTCGFSAVVNRRLAHRAGLFYEDEMEITGLAEEPSIRNGRPGLADVAGVILGRRRRGGAGPPRGDAGRGGRRGGGGRRAPLALHRRARPALVARRGAPHAAAAAAAAGRHPEALLRRAHVGRRHRPAHVAPVPPARRARQRGPVRAAAGAAAARRPRARLGVAVAARAAPLGAARARALLARARRRLPGARARARRAGRAAARLPARAVRRLRGLPPGPPPPADGRGARGAAARGARARVRRAGRVGAGAAAGPRGRLRARVRGGAARRAAAAGGAARGAHAAAGRAGRGLRRRRRRRRRRRQRGRRQRQRGRRRLVGGARGRRAGAGAVRAGAARRARAPPPPAARAAAPRRQGAPPSAPPQPTHQDNITGGRVVGVGGARRRRRLRRRGAARAGVQRVRRRAAAPAAPRRRQVAHRLRHRRQRQPLPQLQGRKEPRPIQAVLARVGAGAAAAPQGGGGDVGHRRGVRRRGRRAVPLLLPLARPALAAGRRHRRARRAARHRRHQHTRACQITTEAVGAGAAAGAHQADGLHAGRDEPGRAALAAGRRPRRTHRPWRAQRLELAPIEKEPRPRLVGPPRDLRQLLGAVPRRRALHPVRVPRVHRAGLVPAPHGGPLHAGRALLAGLYTVAPAHAARRHCHAHTRLPHLCYHAVKPNAIRTAHGERRGQRHDVPRRGHGGRGHGRGQHDGPADRRHVQQHVGAGQPARVAAPPRRRRRGLAARQPRAPPPAAAPRRPRRAGTSGHRAPAAFSVGVHGVDGTSRFDARVVVGELHPPAGRLPRLPEERVAPTRGQRAVGRRLHVVDAAEGSQHAPVGLADHYRCFEIRIGRLQRAFVARARRQHARPHLLPAPPRASPHAALPHGRRARIDLR